jgi:chromosomal replication initiator protein
MTMGYGGLAGQAIGGSAPGEVWAHAAAALRAELGDDTYGSWLGQAALRQGQDGALALVTPTATARDWVNRNAWRRISELWSKNDPLHRPLNLKSRAEFDAAAGDQARTPAPVETAAPVAKAETVARADPRSARSTCLQDRFTFETFVQGPANDFAFDMAKRVAAWSDGHFNPVIFHGPFGFGKTHLMNAIAWEAARNAPDKKVIYLTAERFLSGFVRALMDKTGPAFKEELRAADLLLIDDVHFVAGKQSSQEELFHTLAARAEVLEFLADRFTDSVRELEGALNTLVARAGAGVGALSLDEAQTILRPHLRSGEKRITVDEIQKATAEHYGMRQVDLISERRNRAIARPRQAAMWLAKHLTTRSLPDIGRRFGGRDHTTVLHAVRRIEALKVDDAQLARDLEVLTRKLRG